MKYKIIILILWSFLFPSLAFARQEINIEMTHPANVPYFIGRPELNIDAEEFSTIILRIKSDKSGTARLFWASSYDPQINEPKSIWFFLDKSAGHKEYIFNVRSQNRHWAGFIGQILVYCDDGAEGIDIESAKAAVGNPITFLKSGWREFWGPGSRVILGSSVNNMRPLTLWGKPFNYYLYAIILMAAVASFGYYFYRSNDLNISWHNCGKVTILTSIAMWAVWQASFMVTEYYWLKSDLAKYDFKSLEEKQKISIGEDFYNFLNFCRQQLPNKAKVKIISSGPNESFFVTKGNYYLYPIDVFSKEPEYIVTYYYTKGLQALLKDNPGFRLLKKYNEGAYILWKKKA